MVLAHKIDEGRRTRDIQITQDVTFDSLLLAPNTLQGLRSSGFYKPSPVQLNGIPLGKCGFDLLIEAKSGTGKTAVFSVITLEKLDLAMGLQAVILAPTREIASQVCDVIKQIGSSYEGLVVEVVMGGLPVVEDVAKFTKKVHIVVGSPGRVRHLIQDNHINISSVRLLVLDEADKLMEKSFLPDINYIFSILPKQKQVIMSSATYPDNIKTFINKFVKCAQHICPDSNCVLLGVDQKITVVKSHTNIVRQTQYRFEELLKILSSRQFKQCLIFCNYQARVYELYKKLVKEKWPVEQLCGKQEQSDRLDALKTLQEYKCRILISTDLAARGIDASNVDLVIHFEPPFEWQTYLHRMGRAGRYGSYGMSIIILGEGKEENAFKKMLESISLDGLKLTHFWTSQKSEFDENRQDINKSLNNFTPGEFEIEYKEIWNELISDYINIEKEIEEFEVLCKSFEESKPAEIESFADLLSSYEINRNKFIENCNSTYQHKKLNSKANTSFFKLIETLKRNCSSKNNIFEPITIYEANPGESNQIKTSPEKIHENPSYISKNEYNAPKTLCSKDEKLQYDNNDLNHINNGIYTNHKNNNDDQCFNAYEYDISQPSTHRALLQAGLPLGFGCPKKNSGFYKKRSNLTREDFREKVHGAKTSSRINHNGNVDSGNPNSQGTKSSHYKRQEATEHQNKENKSKIHRNKTYSRRNNNLYDDNQTNYVNWYNQLKNTVKQIELAIYIEEMSKS